ncbi:hypothetical protein AOQ84DRAFT_372958 [Glonium stellatum]|uniref:Uncharacterized protein n=1 Tax=Glonium stellatum TaxID=574774 RepID=A0A8E2JWX9_9PEZI|nr:hypothetical protein AOQ84DRAFT_372958 [Glonium stellatum]
MYSQQRQGGMWNDIWEEKYSKRRSKTLYEDEDNREGQFSQGVSVYEYLKRRDKGNLISTFLEFSKDILDTPSTIKYAPLMEYLSDVSMDDIWTFGTPTGPSPSMIILDERQDTTAVTARVWDSDHPLDSTGSGGYLSYPTFGTNTRTERVNIPKLLNELTKNSRSFSLEFHIPYFALRLGSAIPDQRTLQGRGLRTHRLLPLRRLGELESYYYEAQISFLMTGLDEWLWTTYCCVDTFFGSETDREAYLNPLNPTDAATGGWLQQQYPVWNPREYFLAVLSRRMLQERSFEIPDDAMLTRTIELTPTVATLRQFTDLLASTIKTCNNFQSGYMSLFNVGSIKLMEWWQGYITSFNDSVLELEALHMIMSQKLELFNSMLDKLVSASALNESTQATRQADNIGILTKMTVV